MNPSYEDRTSIEIYENELRLSRGRAEARKAGQLCEMLYNIYIVIACKKRKKKQFYTREFYTYREYEYYPEEEETRVGDADVESLR